MHFVRLNVVESNHLGVLSPWHTLQNPAPLTPFSGPVTVFCSVFLAPKINMAENIRRINEKYQHCIQQLHNTWNVDDYHRPITSYHFSHVHATFWHLIEQCSNRRWNLVPEESGPRFAWHTYQKSAPEKWSRFMALVSGACVMVLSYQYC